MMLSQCNKDIRPLALQISGELSQDERATVAFLCLDVLKDYSAIEEVKDLFEILSKQNLLRFELLAELIYRIKRFDILKKMKADPVSFKDGHGYISSYRQLLVDISENLSQEDLQSIFFILRCQIPKGHQEAMKTFLDLIVELEKLAKIDVNNLKVVEDCLQTIGRIDLRKKILKYTQMRESPGAHSTRRSDAYQNVIPISVPCRELGIGPENVERNRPVSTLLPAFAGCHTSQLLRYPVHSNFRRSSFASSAEHHSETLSNPVGELAQAAATGYAAPQNGLEMYRVQSTPLGLCLIVDCIGTDAELLKKTFEALQFRVLLHLCVELDELKEILRETAQREDLVALDCFVCCIVSRGTVDCVLAIDGISPGLPFDQIQQYFKGQSCRALLGKPRLFFVQDFLTATANPDSLLETDTAQSNREMVQADSRPWEEVVPQEADILWSCCRVSEHVLIQAPQQPSSFMRSLSECLHQHKCDLVSMLTEVNRQTMLRNRQLAGEEPAPLVLRHTLRKKLIFP
ncbi:CASP8 and FADD-like apoptosis regulator [Scyliorhinus torazame]|uniref:CASP8 and FADD-like apoptosis regulator n=1 Tax=Scyliorhinus torazame TaxID=75743 RepID=UPI003B596BEE